MRRYYHFAGLDFMINLPDERMYREDWRLSDFRAESVLDPHCFRFEMVDLLEMPQEDPVTIQPGFRVYQEKEWSVRYIGSVQQSTEGAYIRAAHREKEHYVQLKRSHFQGSVGSKTVLNSLMVEHLVAQADGVILHASYIAWNGNAILFTAPSGTGKSTQAELWKRFKGAEIVNGDRAVVRLEKKNILAEGIPFAGSSKYCCNRSLPLAAIVYLSQAPCTVIRRIKGIQAFMRVWEGCSVNTWDKEDVSKVSDLVSKVIRDIPVYRLDCTPDESAVTALEQELRKEL